MANCERVMQAPNRSTSKSDTSAADQARLLALGLEAEALPHLHALAERGVAEAAFCLGVSANRRGDFVAALGYMERALELAPAHERTRQQVVALRAAIGGVPVPKAVPAAGPDAIGGKA